MALVEDDLRAGELITSRSSFDIRRYRTRTFTTEINFAREGLRFFQFLIDLVDFLSLGTVNGDDTYHELLAVNNNLACSIPTPHVTAQLVGRTSGGSMEWAADSHFDCIGEGSSPPPTCRSSQCNQTCGSPGGICSGGQCICF